MLDNLDINEFVEIPYITKSGERITYYCGACGFMSTEFFYGNAYAFTNRIQGNWLAIQANEMVQKGNDFLNKKIKTGKAEKLENMGFAYNGDQIFKSNKTGKLYFLLQCFVENAEMEAFNQFMLGNDIDYYLDSKENIIYMLVNNKIGKVSDISMHEYIHASIKLDESSMRPDINSKKFYEQLNKLVGTKIAHIKRK